MRLCHITPHLPPDQAANALLPFHLGEQARAVGDHVAYVSHVPRRAGTAALPGPVVWIPRRQAGRGPSTTLSSVMQALRIVQAVLPVIRACEVVHLHSNGPLCELGAWLARRLRKPTVLTLYGTDIWHYRPRRGIDLFTSSYRQADHVTFYSRGLMRHAEGLGLRGPAAEVLYPPVAAGFHWHSRDERAAVRHTLGVGEHRMLVNVKRLHPLAGQRYLIDAMPRIRHAYPDARLFVCGSGPLLNELRSRAEALGVGAHVSFVGQIDNDEVTAYCAAADLFILPSTLEACPTVALEALACGTRVISADNPGGVELHELFGDDLRVVPREDADALADAVIEALATPRRTRTSTVERIGQEFRPDVVAGRYRAIYRQVITARLR